MLNSLKWMMIKNDPDKMYNTYFDNPGMKDQIIERLFELNSLKDLINISMKDPAHRTEILTRLHEDKQLDIYHYREILKWLQQSVLQSKMIQYISKNFKRREINNLLNTKDIPRPVKNKIAILSGIQQKSTSKTKPDNEDYIKLKILIEENDIALQESSGKEKVENESTSSESAIIAEFIEKRKTFGQQEEFDYLKNIIIECKKKNSYNVDFILCLINLSKLSSAKKIDIVREVECEELIDPKAFQIISDSSELPFSIFRSLFSLTTINEWIATFLRTHYDSDLFYLYSNYKAFSWLSSFLHNIEIAESIDINTSDVKYYLRSEFGYWLYDLIPNQDLLKKLKESCHQLQNYIDLNIHNESFDIEFFLKPFLLIGGDDNINYIASLLNRRVVESTQNTIRQIESNYLMLKTKIDNPDELQKLIDNEIVEKANLISKRSYLSVANLFFKTFSDVKNLYPSVKKILTNNLPDLSKYKHMISNPEVKIMICKFIGFLKLTDYKSLLQEFLGSSDYRVSLQAAISLECISDASVKKVLQELSQSPNYVIRAKLAESLQYLQNKPDDKILFKLAQDKNLEVCKNAINTIKMLPVDTALKYFEKIIPNTYYKNKPFLSKALGEIATIDVLPLLVELVRHADNDDYQAIINAISNIDHDLSEEFLGLLKLNGNHHLELERAKALIKLGSTKAWGQIDKYMSFNSPKIATEAKIFFLQQSYGENLDTYRKLTFDNSPIIATLATGKLFIYDEEAGWEAIERLRNMDNPDKKYLLAHLFAHLPFAKIKKTLYTISQTGDYSTKIISAIIFYKNGVPNHLQNIENAILSLSSKEHLELIKGIREFPNKYCMSIIRKIAIFQNPETFEKALNLLENLPADEALEIVKFLWNKANINSKVSIVKICSRIKSNQFIHFLKSNISNQSLELTSELAYALICQGDDSGWNILNNLLHTNQEMPLMIVLERVARINSQQSFTILTNLLSNTSENVQSFIIKSLGTMKMREALPVLEKYSRSFSNKVKISVAKSLGEMNTPESYTILKSLSNDKDEYVKVAAEIGLQKMEKGVVSDLTNYFNIFQSIFKMRDWKLSPDWFTKSYINFVNFYDKYESKDIMLFDKASILDDMEMQRRKKKIQTDLNRKLIGSTNVDEIMKAKEKAALEENSISTKGSLIKSMLQLNSYKIKPEVWNIINSAVKSNDSQVLKAVLLLSVNSRDKKWHNALKIISEKVDHDHLIDLLIYSIFKKKSGLFLPIIITMLNKERARYYFLYLYNHYLLYSNEIAVTHLREARKTAQTLNAPPQIKEALKHILNSLVELKLS